jgi:hypothetical protein
MQSLSDSRRLRVYRLKSVGDEFFADPATDVWQEVDGTLHASNSWEDLLFISKEDAILQAREVGLSPLEWFRTRLLSCPLVHVEVM